MAAPTASTGGGDAPPMPKMTGMLITMLVMVVLLMFNTQIGELMNYVMQVIDFNYEWPVVTLVLAGLIMTTLSTVIRALMTDLVKQQKNQQEMKAFNAELRQARLENNLYKIKKLTDQQQKMMAKNMESSMGMMKTMPITMIIVIPLYAWVRYFVRHMGELGLSTAIHVPWGIVDLATSIWFLPAWILIYTLITIPYAQLVNRLIRSIEYRKRLKELEAGDGIEVL